MKIGVVLGIGLVAFVGLFVTLIVKGEKNHGDQSVKCTEKGGQYVRARDMSPLCIKKDAIIDLNS